jgi:hypothetical protein
MASSHAEQRGWRAGHPVPRLLELVAFEAEAAGPEAVAHGEGCDRCRAEVAALRAERERFLALRPARPFVARVVERSAQERPRRWGWSFAPRLAFAAGAAALLALVTLGPAGGPGVSFKGAPASALSLYASRGGEPARPLGPGQPLHPGDLLRFGVRTSRGAYALVAGLDAEGRVSRYFPQAAGPGDRLEGREAVQLLPGSVILDETLGREWIVLLLSAERLPDAAVEEALGRAWRGRQGEALGPLGLDAEVHPLAVTKVPR